MAYIGRFNLLKINSIAPQGVYLDGAWLGNILLPKRFVPDNCQLGDKLNVFIYLDSEDRLIATTQLPKVQVGEVAYLSVKEINKTGAFLDWGLPKDLLVPFNQQQITMAAGRSYLVYVYCDDDSDRIVASSKLNKFIQRSNDELEKGQAVDLIISDLTDLGYAAVINHQTWGLLFYDDVVKPLKVGQSIKGYVKRIREDGKIDLSLQAPGIAKIDDLSRRVLRELKAADGFLGLSDKSPPEEIYTRFGVSKKSYKMTIGSLYKQRLIRIEKDGIYELKHDRDETGEGSNNA